MSIIDESDDSAAAAIGYANAYFDGAVTKIDATFGSGFAKANPVLIGAMIQACATNLVAFMQAAGAMPPDLFDMMPEDDFPEAPKKPKKGGR